MKRLSADNPAGPVGLGDGPVDAPVDAPVAAPAGPPAEPRRRGPKPDPHGREKVLAAAADAFMRRGYSGTSVDEIAGALGVTKGFVYHHYDSKSELYFAVQEAAIEGIDATVRAVFETTAGPEDRLERMAEAHVLAILANFPAMKVGVQGLERSLMQSAGPEERRRLKRILQRRGDYEAMFTAVIGEGMSEGVFRSGPVELVVKGVLGALNWVTLWFDPDRPTAAAQKEEIARSLAHFAVQGLK